MLIISMIESLLKFVISVQTEIQKSGFLFPRNYQFLWIPAYAGMTSLHAELVDVHNFDDRIIVKIRHFRANGNPEKRFLVSKKLSVSLDSRVRGNDELTRGTCRCS